jgi:hypothetical protein
MTKKCTKMTRTKFNDIDQQKPKLSLFKALFLQLQKDCGEKSPLLIDLLVTKLSVKCRF